jgi:hypothetical protein
MKCITFAITALRVGTLAPKFSEFFADVWVLKSALIFSGAMTSGIEFANVPLFVLWTRIWFRVGGGNGTRV